MMAAPIVPDPTTNTIVEESDLRLGDNALEGKGAYAPPNVRRVAGGVQSVCTQKTEVQSEIHPARSARNERVQVRMAEFHGRHQ